MAEDRKSILEDTENYIALMALYRDEWKHRDDMFVLMFWKFIYLALIITFLPNFLSAVNIHTSLMQQLPAWAFSIAGIGCSLFGLFLGLGESKRIELIDLAYKEVAKQIPSNYRVASIKKRPLHLRLNNVLCVVTYGIVILLAITNLIISLL